MKIFKTLHSEYIRDDGSKRKLKGSATDCLPGISESMRTRF